MVVVAVDWMDVSQCLVVGEGRCGGASLVILVDELRVVNESCGRRMRWKISYCLSSLVTLNNSLGEVF